MSNNYCTGSTVLKISRPEHKEWWEDQTDEVIVTYNKLTEKWHTISEEEEDRYECDYCTKYIADNLETYTTGDELETEGFIDMTLSDLEVYFRGDEQFSAHLISHMVYAFFKHFNLSDSLSIGTAQFNDRTAVDQQGGSAYFITKHGVQTMSTWEWLEDKQKEHEEGK